MAVSQRTRIIVIVVGVAVLGYLAWRWWQNNQSGSGSANGSTLGTNLNSPAPILDGGSSSGDNSAPSYSAGSETINVTLPNGEDSTSSTGGTTNKTPPPGKNPPPKKKVDPPFTGKPIKAKGPVHKVPVKA